MDYSSAADQPIAKSFDNVIEDDFKGNFLVEYAPRCFAHCVPKIIDAPLNQNEISCLKECYVKAFYSANNNNI